MKNHLSLISRFAVVALATGGLCFADAAYGQKKEAAAGIAPPEPGRVGSMAPVGTKPSKAELAKMEAEKAAQNGKAPAKDAKMAMGTLDQQDQTFIMEAAKGSMMEVEMGKMAVKMGKSPEVKNVGKTLVTDHTRANGELMALAKAKGVKLPPAPKMPKMSADNFDSAFLTQAMQDHQKDIAAYERAAKNSKDPEVKAWAKKMVPVLKGHMNAVKKAMGSSKAG